VIAKRKGVVARRGLKKRGAKARADEQEPDEPAQMRDCAKLFTKIHESTLERREIRRV